MAYVIGIAGGMAIGMVFPAGFSAYVAMGILACMDSLLGGIYANMRQDFRAKVYATAFGISEKVLKIYKRQNECMREVVLYWKERSCHIRGFADTGNHLIDPISKKPVSIITLEDWHRLVREEDKPMYRLIPYKSVGNPNGLLQGIEIDYMAILEGDNSKIIERPMIAITEQPFTGIFHYSILLHSDYC